MAQTRKTYRAESRRPYPLGFLGIPWLLLMAGALRAQDPVDADAGFLAVPPVSVERLGRDCITPLYMGRARVDTLPCVVRQVLIADTMDALAWTVVRYRRGAVERYEGAPDTLPVEEVLLAGVDREAGTALPVWHTVRDRTFEVIQSVTWLRRREGLILAVGICLNGTGGCYHNYLLGDGDHWVVVDQRYREQLAAQAPAGFRLHKGGTLDLKTFTGEQPIAKESDANCCPSGLMRFSVWLDGHVLRLLRVEVETRHLPPTPGP